MLKDMTELLSLLGRARQAVILASSDVAEPAKQLRDALERRGCEVIAGIEGAEMESISASATAVDVVLFLGDPTVQDAWSQGPLQSATAAAFEAVGNRIPMSTVGTVESTNVRELPGSRDTVKYIAEPQQNGLV
uniref:Uncharacterized protein n=1 Tax=Noctiluca scintillans TaxID=2966 RepID=A0A7S1FJV5_NOCSC|mmetsp:Transcript_992/g.2833  ORF Transcript_992/g.2833 Transcript_992/m.2833 type:complete len:134 (+) Transcript_992:52-453(+)